MLVRLAGIEPATLGLEGRCSIQLSYRRGKGLRDTGDESTPLCADFVLKGPGLRRGFTPEPDESGMNAGSQSASPGPSS